MTDINLGELAVVSLRNRTGKLADNITNHNPVLKLMQTKGRVRTADGGREIIQEIEYAENGTVAWVSEFEQLSTTPQDVFDASTWDWKTLAGTIVMSGLEEVKNSGKERIINFLSAKIDNLEKSLANQLAESLFSDGTGAKEIGGLRFLVKDDPTTSSVIGGINQSTYTWWRNHTETNTATASTIGGAMNTLWLECTRGVDKPDVIASDSTYYSAFEASLQANQRFTNDSMAKLGFENIAYKSAPVVYDANCPARMYFLNTDYLFLRPHQSQFEKLEKRNSFNQDAFTIPVVWYGNLTCSNRKLQGVIKPS